ncbi:MAG: ABC transporter permease, partial [candidate division Zixibacteria bacterium]|nr:ABC transporter permease [candidate division Zixibacteria bacterium]
MLRNYLKIAIRYLLKHRGYSAINVLGLAIGLACTILIGLWIQDELSFDGFHANGDRIHRVLLDAGMHNNSHVQWKTQGPLAATLKTDIPEISHATRYSETGRLLLTYDGQSILQDKIGLTDPDFLAMFTYPMIQGDPATALSSPGSLILTESMARKLYGDADPMDRVLNIGGAVDCMVKGVIQDPPVHSTFQFSCLIPFEHVIDIHPQFGNMIEDWHVNGWQTFVMLTDVHAAGSVSDQVGRFVIPDEEEE